MSKLATYKVTLSRRPTEVCELRVDALNANEAMRVAETHANNMGDDIWTRTGGGEVCADNATIEAPSAVDEVLVDSDTQHNVKYRVTLVQGVAVSCTCTGFHYYGRCKHIKRINGY